MDSLLSDPYLPPFHDIQEIIEDEIKIIDEEIKFAQELLEAKIQEEKLLDDKLALLLI